MGIYAVDCIKERQVSGNQSWALSTKFNQIFVDIKNESSSRNVFLFLIYVEQILFSCKQVGKVLIRLNTTINLIAIPSFNHAIISFVTNFGAL